MRYNLNLNVPLGVPIFGAPKKEIWPAIIGAAAALGGGALDNYLDYDHQKALMRRQQQIDQENMAYSQQLNKDYQNYLYNTQYGAQVKGMLNAGLNPAGANASIGGMQGHSGPSTGSSAPNPIASHLSSSMSAGAAAGAQVEQAESNKKSTESQVSLNETQEGVNNSTKTKNEAEALKAISETKMTDAQRERFNEQVDTTLAKMKAETENVQSDTQYKQQLTDNLKVENQKLYSEMDEIRSRIANINEDTKTKILSRPLLLKRMSAEIRSTLAQAGFYNSSASNQLAQAAINYILADNQQSVIDSKLALENAEMVAAYSLSSKSQAETNLVNKEAELKESYGDAEAISGIVAKALGTAVGTAAGVFGLGKLGKAATVVKGFGK